MQIGWIQIVGLVAGSSVLAALVNQGITIFREHLRRNGEARLSALYVALALEAYASDCSSIISDCDKFAGTKGKMGVRHDNLPLLTAYPMEVDWKALGIQTTATAMTLRVTVEAARARFSFIREHLDHVDHAPVTLVLPAAAQIGLHALAAAEKIRRHHALPPMEFHAVPSMRRNETWSVRDHLKATDKLFDR